MVAIEHLGKNNMTNDLTTSELRRTSLNTNTVI